MANQNFRLRLSPPFPQPSAQVESPWAWCCGYAWNQDADGVKAAQEFYDKYREFCGLPKYYFCHDVGADVIGIEEKGR